MPTKCPEKHKKNSLISVQCAGTKPKNSTENDLVHISTEQSTGHRSINILLMVSVDPRYGFKFCLSLCEIDGAINHTSTELRTVDGISSVQGTFEEAAKGGDNPN